MLIFEELLIRARSWAGYDPKILDEAAAVGKLLNKKIQKQEKRIAFFNGIRSGDGWIGGLIMAGILIICIFFASSFLNNTEGIKNFKVEQITLNKEEIFSTGKYKRFKEIMGTIDEKSVKEILERGGLYEEN